jgi:cell wall-associated NlpC family hydrolase
MRWRVLGMVGLLVVPGAVPVGDEVARVVAAAYAITGTIPYSWGGGHAARPGPSRGTCSGYQGEIQPCPARKTRGLDCSGLARWVYHIGYGQDVLGPGNTDSHLKRLRRVTDPRSGDLVFFGTRKRTHHSGIYIGQGKMINAYATGTMVRVDSVHVLDDLLGYYRY